ncbi:MAG TPA: hypothetical protein VF814_03010 [Casimicrobiaceae bacterium]
MSFLKILIVCITLVTAQIATAVVPDGGWYFNPNESGRGFNIEIQNNTLFMAAFIYDVSGNPIWLVSGGPMSTATTYSGDVYQTSSGQPLGGAYRSATITLYGYVTIDFTTTTTATINLNGVVFSVTRELFGVDFTSTTQPLLGEFGFVTGDAIFPVYFGDRISFTSIQTINGSQYAVGNRTGETGANNIAVGQYSPALGQWTVLLDSSPSYYEFFTFTFEGVNLVEGTESTFLKTSLPSASSSTVGNRFKSAQAAAGSNAPGVKTARVAVAGADSYAAEKASIQTPSQLAPAELDALHELQTVLESLK